MTVQISNTNLNDNFNTWRLNTNLIATVLSNNVVTVSRAGSANRGGYAVGNGHIDGTFSASNLRTETLGGGNTTVTDSLSIVSNASFTGTTLTVSSNATFEGNVNFNTTGSDRLILGDISRIRLTGGSTNQFLFKSATDTVSFKTISLEDVSNLTTGASHFTLVGSNSQLSDNGDSPEIRLITDSGDTAKIFVAQAPLVGDSDLYAKLADLLGDSKFVIANVSNTEVASISSQGDISANAITATSVTPSSNFLPNADDSLDLGSSSFEWKDLYIDGVAYIDELSMGTSAGQGIATSLIPKTDAAGNLGSVTRKWGTVFADNTNGGLGVFKTLGVSGNLNANGSSSLNATTVTTLGANGAVDLNSTLNVDGATTLNGLTATTFSANGATTLKGTVELGDASTDTITVKGNFANQSTSGLATFDGNVKVQGTNLTISSEVNSNIIPDADNGVGHYNLGSTSKRWNTLYANNTFANNITVDNNVDILGDLSVQGNTTFASGGAVSAPEGTFTSLSVSGIASFEGNVDLGNASGDIISITGSIDTDIIPTGSRNVGSSGSPWNNGFFTGTLNTDVLTVDENSTFTGAVDINNNVDISGNLSNDGTKIISNNGKIYANNAITGGTITNAMLATHGNPTGTFGSATKIPVITIDDRGRVTNISNTSVAGVSAFSYASANNTFKIDAADGSNYTATISSGSLGSALLENSGVIASAYGSSTQVPVITVNAKGIITGVTTSTVAGVSGITYTQSNNNIRITTADGSTFDDVIDPATANTDGSNGGLTNRGVASFDSGDFTVSDGFVSLKNATTGAVLAIGGTANEVNVSRTNGTVTVGLPDDVTVTGQLNVGENIVISGNLIVNGTTTTINSTTVRVEDNIIVLNEGVTGTPSLDSGLTVERGTSANKSLLWNETIDKWTVGSETFVAGTFEGNLTGTADSVSNALSAGSYLTGDSFDGSASRTFAVDATSLNTASKVVARDGSGNFSASIITASLSGNASTASELEVARNIQASGDISWGVSFDGSDNVSSVATIQNGVVDTDQLASGAVTNEKLALNAIDTNQIADDAVDTNQIANNAVTNAKIASDAVDSSKLDNVQSLQIINSTGTVLKTIYGAGS